MTRRLLGCGLVAGPLFIAALLIEGATRAGYSPLRHPGSSLALGDWGWTQDVNFIVAGLLTLAYAVGLRRALRSPAGSSPGSTWGPPLVGIWGLQLVCAGIFVSDPVSGYPPGTPDQLAAYGSAHAAIHDMASLIGFAGLVAACLVFSRRFATRGERGWAIYSAVTAVVFLAAIVLASAAFSQAAGLVEIGGLVQRVAIVTGFAWQALLAVHLRTALSKTRAELPG